VLPGQVVPAERQLPYADTRSVENGVGKGGSDSRRAGFSGTTESLTAVDDVSLDNGRFVHTQYRVVVEIALCNGTVANGNVTV
jgi:hypothetical protein